MTDTSDHHNPQQPDEHRRSSDPKIDEILETQRVHMKDYHANLSPGEAAQYVNRVDQMERGFEDLRVTTDRVLVILDGKEESNASGEITRIGGVSKDLAVVSTDVAELKVAVNGGKLSVTRRDKMMFALIAITPSVLVYLNTVAGGR